MSTIYLQKKTTIPALKEALWPLSKTGIFTTSRALILYWLIWAITTCRGNELPPTHHQHIDMAVSMTSIRAFYLTACLVANSMSCLMVFNLAYVYLLLRLDFITWVTITVYLKVVKPYHRGGGKHLTECPVLCRIVPLRQWVRRQLGNGYPEIDDLVADSWKTLSLWVKTGGGL